MCAKSWSRTLPKSASDELSVHSGSLSGMSARIAREDAVVVARHVVDRGTTFDTNDLGHSSYLNWMCTACRDRSALFAHATSTSTVSPSVLTSTPSTTISSPSQRVSACPTVNSTAAARTSSCGSKTRPEQPAAEIGAIDPLARRREQDLNDLAADGLVSAGHRDTPGRRDREGKTEGDAVPAHRTRPEPSLLCVRVRFGCDADSATVCTWAAGRSRSG